MARWEYRVFKFSPSGTFVRGGRIPDEWLATELNKLGQEGWELVGTCTSAIELGATNEVAAILKRSSEPTRECPECAETIKAEAHVCHFCGARFSEEEIAEQVAAAVARSGEVPEGASEVPEGEPLQEIESDDPSLCRFCGRNSRANWHSARERVCRDCIRRPEVQAYLQDDRA